MASLHLTVIAASLHVRSDTFHYKEDEEKATSDFITRKKQEEKLRFLGIVIERFDSHLEVYQDNHINRLQTMEEKSIDRDQFRRIRGQLLFIAQSSRPDIAYTVSQLCQVKYDAIETKHVKLLNQVVKHLQETSSLRLKYKRLDKKTIRLLVFVDSGYNTNADGTSQLGVVIFLADADNNCQFLHWSSTKCPRVTRSMLASETYAFSTGYDYGVSLKIMFKPMNIEVPLFIFTDFKSIFDTITASKHLRELRLMNDISDIRRAYRENEITNVAWVRSKQNIADNLTRYIGNDILRKTMETGRLDFIIEQWVCKDSSSSERERSQQKGKEKQTNVKGSSILSSLQ